MVPALPETSRRALLTGMGTGIVTALAGCSASETHQSQPDGGTLVTDHETATTRSSDGRPPVVAPRQNNGATSDADESPTTSEPLSIHTIESESEAAEIEFIEDATNVGSVRQLLDETTFANESVLLYQTHISECYRLKLNYVTRDDDDPDIQFCQVVRDADVDCERTATDHVAAFVRLPFPGDEYGGYSIGSGGSCDPTPERDRNGSESA